MKIKRRRRREGLSKSACVPFCGGGGGQLGVCATVLRCVHTHGACWKAAAKGECFVSYGGEGGEIKPLAHRTLDIGEMPLLFPPPLPELLKLPSAHLWISPR